MKEYNYALGFEWTEKDDFDQSPHGYWITPKGELLSLTKEFKHGEIVMHYDPEQTKMLDGLLDDYDRFNQKYTTMDIYAVNEWKWVRISIGWGGWNFSFPDTMTKVQMDWIEYLSEMLDFKEEDVWDNLLGQLYWPDMMNEIKDRVHV